MGRCARVDEDSSRVGRTISRNGTILGGTLVAIDEQLVGALLELFVDGDGRPGQAGADGFNGILESLGDVVVAVAQLESDQVVDRVDQVGRENADLQSCLS